MTRYQHTQHGNTSERPARRSRRLLRGGLLLAVVGLAVAGAAFAYFPSSGSGTASASVGVLGAPAHVQGTPGAGTVDLSWDAVTPPASGSVSYYVSRDGTPVGDACGTPGSPISTTSCTDSGLGKGTYQYTVTALWQSWTATSSPATSVTLASGAATKIVLSGATADLASGSTRQLTATVEDSAGNTVSAGPDSGISIDFEQAGGGGSVSGTGSTTATAGIATETVTGVLAGSVNMTATGTLSGPGSTTSNTLGFTVVPGPPSGAESTLTPTSASITANGTSTQVLTVHAEDVNGNDETAGGATVTITRLAGTGSVGSVNDNGDGTYTATVTSPTATGSGVFVATLDGNPVQSGTGSQTQSTITYVAGQLDHFAFSLTSPQTDGVAFTGTNTLTAEDANNNAITSFDASANNVTISADSPLTGSVSGLSGGNELTSASDFVNGVADLSSLGMKYTGNTGTGTFTATSANSKTGTSGNVQIEIGGLDHFAFSLTSPQTDGSAFTGSNTLTAKDVGNNTITTFDASTNTVTISANSPLTGTVSGLSGGNRLTSASDFSGGIANLTALGMKYTGNAASGTFTATSASGKSGNSGNVQINVGALDHFALSLTSPQANGNPFTGTNTLTAQDIGNNTVTSFSASTNNVTVAANSPLTGSVSGLSGGTKLTSSADFVNGVADLTNLGMTYTGNTGTGTFTATSANGKTGTSGNVAINGVVTSTLDLYAEVQQYNATHTTGNSSNSSGNFSYYGTDSSDGHCEGAGITWSTGTSGSACHLLNTADTYTASSVSNGIWSGNGASIGPFTTSPFNGVIATPGTPKSGEQGVATITKLTIPAAPASSYLSGATIRVRTSTTSSGTDDVYLLNSSGGLVGGESAATAVTSSSAMDTTFSIPTPSTGTVYYVAVAPLGANTAASNVTLDITASLPYDPPADDTTTQGLRSPRELLFFAVLGGSLFGFVALMTMPIPRRRRARRKTER